MARIDIKSAGGASLDAGILQLANGVAMSATLTAVTDQSNTASPLLLSTTGVQSTSKIQITTADTNYIDAEDNAGNNRFTVGRGTGSQLVTVDFASVPIDLTTAVGAIRTATNGSALANVQTFLENGNIGFGTDTPGSKIDVHSAANTVAQFNRTGTGNSQIQHLMTGTARWTVGYTSTAGNYSIYDNVNAVFRTNLSNTGKLTIGNGDTALTGQLNVKGSGSTSATTSLLVQNSLGTTILNIKDAGSSILMNGLTINNLFGQQAFKGGITDSSITVGGTGNANPRFVNFVQATITSGNGGLNFYNDLAESVKIGSINISNGLFNIQTNQADITAQTALFGSSSTLYVGYFTYETLPASAAVAIKSTTQGFLPPRMTTAQKNAIATPAAGLMIYDTNLNKLCVYTGAGWETITSV